LSAGSGGNIRKCGIKISQTSPFLEINTHGLPKETVALYESIREYLKTVIDGPEYLDKIINNLNQISVECNNLAQVAPEEISKASLSSSKA